MIRWLGLSERFGSDPGHAMAELALSDDCWDVMMVGFNLINQSARHRVFGATQAKRIGVEVMFAVRRALSHPDQLRSTVATLIEQGLVDPSLVDRDDPLGFLIEEAGASSIVDAAYRFVRHEPGCHVVLTGTGSVDHLRANVSSINAAPLPEDALERLALLFGRVDNVSGN